MQSPVAQNRLRMRARQAAQPIARQGPTDPIGPIIAVTDCGVGTPQVRESGTAELTFTVANVGGQPGHYNIDFTVGGTDVASIESSEPLLHGGERSQTVTFRPGDIPLQPGTYPVKANNIDCADIQILADQPTDGGGGNGGGNGGTGGGGNGGTGGGGNGGTGGNGGDGGTGGGGNGGGNGGTGGNGDTVEGEGVRSGLLLAIAVGGALALGRLTG